MDKQHYRFDPAAFRMVPSGAGPYLHAAFAQTLEALEDAYRRGEGCVVLSGPPGTGKSTLAEQLSRRFCAAGGLAPLVMSGQVAGDDLLRLVAFALGIDQATDKARLYLALERRLERHRVRGERILLCVDEAQDLDESALEELRLLCLMQRDSLPLLQILLVGQPGLLTRLGSPPLERFRQRIAAIHRLGVLSREETRGYIGHRLVVVGWRGGPAISGDALELLHEFSGGVPAWINLAAGRVLWRGDAEGIEVIDAEVTREVLAEMEQDGLLPTKEDHDPLGLFAASSETPPLQPLEGEAAKAIARSLELDRKGSEERLRRRHWRRMWKFLTPRWLGARAARNLWQPALGGIAAVVGAALLVTYFDSASTTTESVATPVVRSSDVSVRVAPAMPVAAAFAQKAVETAAPPSRQPLRLGASAAANANAAQDAPTYAADFAFVETAWPQAEQANGDAPAAEVIPDESAATLPDPVSADEAIAALAEPPLAAAQPAPAEPPMAAGQPEVMEPLSPASAGVTGALDASSAPPDRPPADEAVTEPPQALVAAQDPAPPRSAPRASSVADLLAAGAAALADDRLTFPQGHSALDRFSAVLRLEPENAEALAGLQEITARYQQLAAEAIEEGELEEADRFVARGLRIDVEDGALLELRQKLNDLLSARELRMAQTLEPEPEPVEVLLPDPSPPPLRVQPVRHHALEY